MNESNKVPNVIITRAVRWSVVSGLAIAVYWAIHFFNYGPAPLSSQIPNTWGLKTTEISRWWDIFIGPIWSVVLTLLVELIGSPKIIPGSKKSNIYYIAISITVGVLVGLLFNPDDSLIIAGIAGLIIYLESDFATTLALIYLYGFGVSLAYGLTHGLYLGFVTGIRYCLIPMFTLLLVELVLSLSCEQLKEFLIKIGNWFTVKND